MNFTNRNFIRGLFLMAIAALFGGVATKYPIGQLSRSGPGLFPLGVSCMLFAIGLLSVVRSHFVEPVPLDYNVKNIVLVLTGITGLALISQYLNMILGITFLVFVVTYAGTSYSIVRNVKISLGLIAVAFAFKQFLGLQLPLY
ncbi:MAG: tripartite tricarboxylate transporter TctB family protein [Burkholderiaceae bacterium]|nr:tripartite tricarboxylate transporter TctB family protein [Burkholderiaceae bacterium]